MQIPSIMIMDRWNGHSKVCNTVHCNFHVCQCDCLCCAVIELSIALYVHVLYTYAFNCILLWLKLVYCSSVFTIVQAPTCHFIPLVPFRY